MRVRRWLPLLATLLVIGGVPLLAQDSGAEPAGLLDTLLARMTTLRQSFEDWRKSPYERLEQDVNAKQAALQKEIASLQAQLDALRDNVLNVQLTPGPPGPAGPAGPRGATGNAGLPGNLQLAGETCAAGQAVNGFDAFGNVLCTDIQPAATAGVGVDCPDTLVSAADLRRCDLRGQALTGRDLSFATLIRADLRGTLSGTDLQGADLRKADLTGSDLTDVNLSYANLSFARLGSVHVEGGDWSGAVLRRAELSLSRTSNAKLAGADLSDASLILSQHYGSDFSRADLSGADLRQTVFQDSTLFLATTSPSLDQARMLNTICPDGVNSNRNNNSCSGHELR
jgi:uncharacterized protein YjbI with pentapeptide repeats